MLNLNSSAVNDNTAFVNGGGIYNNTGTVNFQGTSEVTGNTALADGGGIFNVNGAGAVNLGSTDVSGNIPNNWVGVAGC